MHETITRLFLLGTPRIECPSGELRLERKTAAVLAYLSLHGPTHKYRLAGRLWPSSGERKARNNMRQLLRRLRLTAGDVVQGRDVIELCPFIEVDASSRTGGALGSPRPLLDGLSFDDAPDFAEWLDSIREELRTRHVRAAAVEAARQEASGHLGTALEHALFRLGIDPLSEEAHRQVARLNYLLGDRAAALDTLERCRSILVNEFGSEPLPETFALERLIREGKLLPGCAPQPPGERPPAAVVHPPALAGRERQWALMERAWEDGRAIFLIGEAGCGKSRLASEFLTSKGSFVLLAGMPGDAHVPYSSHFRHLRALLERYPHDSPPDWARRVLAPWLPELGDGHHEQDDLVGLRLAAASREVFALAARRGHALLADALQFHDDASMRVAVDLLQSLSPSSTGGIRGYVGCCRSGSEGARWQENIDALVESDLAVAIEVPGLEAEDVEKLLEGLHVSEASDLSASLYRYTGGNPLFVLETLQHLLRGGRLTEERPLRLAPSGRVMSLIRRRLNRLSPLALNLARTAGLAGEEFSIALGADALQRSPLELTEALAELESDQVMTDSAFVHDLVREAVLAKIPVAVKMFLHERIARHLETTGAEPGSIARHWLETEQPARAAHWLLKAAQGARRLGIYEEETRLLQRAVSICDDSELRPRVKLRLARSLVRLARPVEAEAQVRSVLAGRLPPELRREGLDALANTLAVQGREAEACALLDEAVGIAEMMGQGHEALGLTRTRALVALRLGRPREALRRLERLLPSAETGSLQSDDLELLNALGAVYVSLGRHEEGREVMHRVIRAARESQSAAIEVTAVANLLFSHDSDGTIVEVLAIGEQALELGTYENSYKLRAGLADGYLRLGRYHEAERHLRCLAETCHDVAFRGMAWARLASVHRGAGEAAAAAAALERALELYSTIEFPIARVRVLRAVAEQRADDHAEWLQRELQSLDAKRLPKQVRWEYEELRQIVAAR